ncbi:glycosyltransferase family 4 protein [Larkinella soli]|uniref:glycosyltransferase family 4 protein n=1 Tax=Larkinella soli TaxID=1770527 RepID=UPI001E5BDB20|nr:glycosyltransferase family 1 protein [Larkinella soli]
MLLKETRPDTIIGEIKVLYDHQSFSGMAYGGVTRYFYELMRAFEQRDDVTFELSLQLSNNEYLEKASFRRHITFKSFAHSMNANRVASLVNRMYSIQRLKAGQFDIFHPTYYHKYFLNHLGSKPFVLTFHDATSERYGKIYPDVGAHLFEVKKALVPRADRIIAVSEFTKEEILNYFDVDPARITVVHHGTPFSDQLPKAVPVKTPGPFLLYVGKRPLYKNFNAFFQAIRPVLKRHPDLHLVCAGGGPFHPDEKEMFEAARLSDRVHFSQASDGALCYLYSKALAFVYPSLNEGFGLPILEAYSCGCPVILSERSSFPEVAGEAAVYFDPEQPESIAQAVEQVVGDEALRNGLRAKGTERLKRFSCGKMAQETLDVYRNLL